MSGKKSNKNNRNKNNNRREIKQVTLSEDGNNTEIVETKIVETEAEETKPETFEYPDEEKTVFSELEQRQKEDSKEAGRRMRSVRIAAISVAVAVSILLSGIAGIMLALWDSNRTMADLKTALFTKEVLAATDVSETEEFVPEEEVSDSKPDTADENVSAAEETYAENDSADAGEVVQAEEETESSEAQEGITSEIAGVTGLVKAGTDDVIVNTGSSATDSVVYVDPNSNYPLPYTAVDESYFTDALFIGDSRLQGFGFWSGLPATYYCATGFQLYKFDTTKVVQTENGKVPIFEALPYDAFTKIYIKVGLNEMGWANEEKFEELYGNFIAMLRQYEPRAIIYVHALLPVTAAKSSTDKSHNNVNIAKRNEALAKFAEANKCYFIDAGPALSDENGALRSEMTSDGIHLSAGYMNLWKQYLMEHAVVVRQ